MNSVSDFVNRLFELQNQLDENLIKEQKDVSSLYYTFDESEVVSAIKNINAESSISTGFGVEKTGYRFLSYVILSYGANQAYISPKANQEFVQKLKNFGVSTPAILYNSFESNIIKGGKDDLMYEVQQSAIGAPIGFNTSVHFVEHLNSLENRKVLNDYSHPLFTELVHKYNLEMLKSRVLTGIPHIENFLKDYTILDLTKALDFHGGNVFFNPLIGYTTIDLDINDCIYNCGFANFEKYLNDCLSQRKVNFNKLFDCVDGTFLHSKRYSYNDFLDGRKEHFEHFMFSGILMKQLLTVMQNSTDPILKDAKKFANEFDYKNMEKDYFGANSKNLNLLYQGLTQNDEKSLKKIRSHFNLSKKYDFQTEFDCESFIQAMDLTYAMEQPTDESDCIAEQ